jgi:FAD/FMN-containing dehydrogenase
MKFTKNKKVYEEDISNIEGKESRVLAVVFPDTLEEIKNLIKLSPKDTDIIPRGSGTSFTSAVSANNSVIVDMSKMKNILDINLNKKTAIVEPGITIRELNESLEEYGLEFPISSIFPGIETIGGMIAKNSSGSRELKYSRMINWLDSLEIINGLGEQIKVSKSDLGDFAGMEGTTGIIIKANLRLTNKKTHSLTILKSDSIDFILDANKKLRLESDSSGIDILSRQISNILGLENKYHIFVEYESEKGLFKKADYEKFMKLRDDAYPAIAKEGFYLLESIKVYADSLEDFLIYLEENNIPYFGHLATGVFYPCFHPSQKEKQFKTLKFAKKLKSSISYNFGFGLKNKEFVLPSDRELIKRIKFRHDAQNKFNLNKLISKPIEAKIELIEEERQEESKEEEEEKQPEEIIDEIVEEQIEEAKEEKQEEAQQTINPETTTLKNPDERELTEEEREKVRKIAFGFFAGKKSDEEEKQNENENEENENSEAGGYIG